jgi:hypothetical protein
MDFENDVYWKGKIHVVSIRNRNHKQRRAIAVFQATVLNNSLPCSSDSLATKIDVAESFTFIILMFMLERSDRYSVLPSCFDLAIPPGTSVV